MKNEKDYTAVAHTTHTTQIVQESSAVYSIYGNYSGDDLFLIWHNKEGRWLDVVRVIWFAFWNFGNKN